MKLTDFEVGDKFRLPDWRKNTFYYIDKLGRYYDELNESATITMKQLRADDWEYYKEPKKEKRKFILYRLASQESDYIPVVDHILYETLEDYLERNPWI